MAKSTLQSRTKSRARRLGLEVRARYSRGEARELRRDLAAKREGGPKSAKPGTLKGKTRGPRQRTAPGNKLNVSGTIPVEPGKTRTNTVASGAGSQREGQTFSLEYDPQKKRYVHAYGQSKGRKVYIRPKTAKQYGYKGA